MFLPFLVPVVNNTGGELDICLSKRLVAFFPPAFTVKRWRETSAEFWCRAFLSHYWPVVPFQNWNSETLSFQSSCLIGAPFDLKIKQHIFWQNEMQLVWSHSKSSPSANRHWWATLNQRGGVGWEGTHPENMKSLSWSFWSAFVVGGGDAEVMVSTPPKFAWRSLILSWPRIMLFKL